MMLRWTKVGMPTRIVALALILIGAQAASAASVEPFAITGAEFGTLGIYSDSLGTQPCATIPTGNVGTLYVIAKPPVDPTPGFTGVEFSIQITNPDGYFINFVPPAGGIVFGDPLDRTPENPLDRSGANIAFPWCRTGSRVAMGTLLVVNLNGGPTELRVERRYPVSNPFIGNCPLFVNCISPSFDFHCMQSCDVNATGGAIASTLDLNLPGCAPRKCAVACPSAPCVSVTATAPTRTCVGEEVTITATATNCSDSAADMDVFVQHVLSGSFTNVQPKTSVVASRTYTNPGCDAIDRDPVVGVVARNALCSQPFGAEIARPMQCTMSCTQNRPPDCSQAAASIATLWPADGSLQSVSMVGITDPDQDPVSVIVEFAFMDEFPGTVRDPNCPDAFFDGPNAVRLRAERDPFGDGRVYVLAGRARDPAGAECSAEVRVCVPRKPGTPCVEPLHLFEQANVCRAATAGSLSDGPSISMLPGGAINVALPVSETMDIRIEAFDVRGRLRRVVSHARFSPGEHVVHWDGKDEAGRPVAAGVYLLRIHQGMETTSYKTIVAR